MAGILRRTRVKLHREIRAARETRKFAGKVYHRHSNHKWKSKAVAERDKLLGEGCSVRVVKDKVLGKWVVYYR